MKTVKGYVIVHEPTGELWKTLDGSKVWLFTNQKVARRVKRKATWLSRIVRVEIREVRRKRK